MDRQPRHRRHGRTSVTLLLLAVALIGAATPSFGSIRGPGSSAGDPTAPTARALLDDAHALALSGRFHEARDLYARAARVQRADGTLPEEALWSLAQMYHGEGRIRRAAVTLKNLAWEAALAGKHVIQTRALLEATLLYGQLGDDQQVERGITKLGELRDYSMVPAELKEAIARRLRIDA